ncbi:MAG: DUF4010 domain-containing protein [Pseudomonadota bacterium]
MLDVLLGSVAVMYNPLELKLALLFGALLAPVVLFGKVLKEWMEETGIYLLAAISGIANVDALNLILHYGTGS